MEAVMARKFIDCREYPSDAKCTVAISADSDKELEEAAVQHACTVHGYQDTPEVRAEIRKLFKEGMPAEEFRKAA
jgi:predicted small metal-binding protein